MHEIYREEYDHNGKPVEVIIFEENGRYIIKSYRDTVMIDRFIQSILNGHLTYHELVEIAKLRIRNNHLWV
ncbi:MAG TPA: hypothetical protein VMI12_17100 [Puia sp.]|nr:hypothetical protein [Puia sp.]